MKRTNSKKCQCGKVARAAGKCGTCYQRERRRLLGQRPSRRMVDAETLQVVVPGQLADKIYFLSRKKSVSVSEVLRQLLTKNV